jgi:hypothetical protein
VSGNNRIRAVDANSSTFQRDLLGLKSDTLKEARRALGELLLVDLDAPPAKLHLHPLAGWLVPSVLDPNVKTKVFTFHLTSNDAWKASFTLENGTAYLRKCAPHDRLDDSP